MKQIYLSNTNRYVTVDDEDYEFLLRFHWHEQDGYAMSGDGIVMHRLIVGASKKSTYVDHKNGNSLDNRKSNVRKATSSQNQMNANRRVDNTTGFKGVGRRNGGYYARITTTKGRISLGQFNSAEEAARAYDAAAKEHFGDFAKLNFPEEGSDWEQLIKDNYTTNKDR